MSFRSAKCVDIKALPKLLKVIFSILMFFLLSGCLIFYVESFP